MVKDVCCDVDEHLIVLWTGIVTRYCTTLCFGHCTKHLQSKSTGIGTDRNLQLPEIVFVSFNKRTLIHVIHMEFTTSIACDREVRHVRDCVDDRGPGYHGAKLAFRKHSTPEAAHRKPISEQYLPRRAVAR